MTRQQISAKGINRARGTTDRSFNRHSAPNGAADAQCAPLQSVQRRRGSHCRIPRLTARRVVEGKRRSAASGRCSEAFSRKRHDFRRGCAGNRNAATRIADPYIPRLTARWNAEDSVPYRVRDIRAAGGHMGLPLQGRVKIGRPHGAAPTERDPYRREEVKASVSA